MCKVERFVLTILKEDYYYYYYYYYYYREATDIKFEMSQSLALPKHLSAFII